MPTLTLHDNAPQSNTLGAILLGLALVSGLWLLWPMFHHGGPLALDEHGSYWMIQDGFPGPTFQRTLNQAAVPPLSAALEKLSLTVFGKSEWALRLPSALCYLLAITVTFLLGRRLANPLLGGGAALLLAWHPDVVDEVRIARAYGLLLLLACFHLGAAIAWLRKPASFFLAACWSLSAAGLMWTHYTSLFLVICTAATALVEAWRNSQRIGDRALPWLLGMLLLGMLVTPLIPSIMRLREWGPFLNFMPAQPPWWKVIGPWWWLAWPAGLVIGGLLQAKQPPTIAMPRIHWLVLGCWSIGPLLLLWLAASADAGSLANPRYRVALAPAAAALMAISLRPASSLLRILPGILLVIVLGWSLSPLRPWQLGRLADPASPDWRTLAHELKTRISSQDLIFAQSGLTESFLVPALYQDREFLDYVACRMSKFYLPRDNQRWGLPFLWDAQPMRDSYLRELRARNDAGQHCWLAAATDTDLNRASADGHLQLARSVGFSEEEVLTLPTARLWRLKSSRSPP